MILYARPDDPAGHAIRLLLAEKSVGVKLEEINDESSSEQLLHLNPYGRLPTLAAHGVTLFDPRVIVEFINERYPHPPMMPSDPVLRARVRLLTQEVVGEWYELCGRIIRGQGRDKPRIRRELTEAILASEALFGDSPYLLSKHYGVADCVTIPVLWRLHHLGISLPREAKNLWKYMQLVFRRPTFVASLTGHERGMAAG